MENSNINWDWDNPSEEQQLNQNIDNQTPPTLDWGESPNPEETTTNPEEVNVNWSDANSTPAKQVEFSTEENIISQEDLDNNNLERTFSFLGNVPSNIINTKLWYVNKSNQEILTDLNLNNLELLNKDCKYQLDLQPNTSLADLMVSISKIGLKSGLKLNNAFLYRLKPNESSINIFKGNPKAHFIYFIQGNHDSGEVILDLSSIGGPSNKLLDSTPGILSIFDGWVPYRISKNTSDGDLIAIAGTFI